jgi:hypothetical protein
MNAAKIILVSMLVLLLFLFTCPVQADSGDQKTLYQTSFATNPRWRPENPVPDQLCDKSSLDNEQSIYRLLGFVTRDVPFQHSARDGKLRIFPLH